MLKPIRAFLLLLPYLFFFFVSLVYIVHVYTEFFLCLGSPATVVLNKPVYSVLTTCGYQGYPVQNLILVLNVPASNLYLVDLFVHYCIIQTCYFCLFFKIFVLFVHFCDMFEIHTKDSV